MACLPAGSDLCKSTTSQPARRGTCWPWRGFRSELLAGAVHRYKAHLIGGKEFAFPRTGKLDISDAAALHRHREDRHRIAWRLVARNRVETGAIDHLALGIEGFEQSRCPRGCPKGDCNGRDRPWESGADGNRLRRHGAGDALASGREMGEEHQHALPFRLLGLTRECEHHFFFFPSRDTVAIAVG